VKVPISEMMVGTKRGREAKDTLLGVVLLAILSLTTVKPACTHQPK
jgi:hypothetical protein